MAKEKVEGAKKKERRSQAEILAAQQLAFAKNVLKANGYTVVKKGKPSVEKSKDDWAEDVSDVFKRIREDLKLLEALSKHDWGRIAIDDPTMNKIIDDAIAKVKAAEAKK